MQFNHSTDYATRILLYLAVVGRSASSQEIAAAMNIPPKYIAAIAQKLKSGGYISTIQGANGGYLLKRAPGDITLYDITLTMEGGVKVNHCSNCSASCVLYSESGCSLNETYKKMHEAIADTLRDITLVTLCADRSVQAAPREAKMSAKACVAV